MACRRADGRAVNEGIGMSGIESKVVAITGASSGIGKIVADAAVVYTGSTIPVAGPRMICWPPGDW